MKTFSPWIALIDDEESIRRALMRLLNSAGLEARSFASGALFIASQQTSKPYCVVLDLHMPVMSGFEVHAWLAKNSPEIPVIVVTGHHSTEICARAHIHKPLAYLQKPMNDQTLLDAIALAALQTPPPTG